MEINEVSQNNIIVLFKKLSLLVVFILLVFLCEFNTCIFDACIFF